jgi:hypothetical protein
VVRLRRLASGEKMRRIILAATISLALSSPTTAELNGEYPGVVNEIKDPITLEYNPSGMYELKSEKIEKEDGVETKTKTYGIMSAERDGDIITKKTSLNKMMVWTGKGNGSKHYKQKYTIFNLGSGEVRLTTKGEMLDFKFNLGEEIKNKFIDEFAKKGVSQVQVKKIWG